MKSALLILLVLGVNLAVWGCSQDPVLAPVMDQSEEAASVFKAAEAKPAPNLIGEMALNRNTAFVFRPDDPVYNNTVPVWEGTITFEGGIGTYGMRFFHLSPKKGYSQVSPFVERFEIYDPNNPATVYLAGPDEGATVLANAPAGPWKYHMNGVIDQASAPFEMWLGRNVHMQGTIIVNSDGTRIAPGTFRAN